MKPPLDQSQPRLPIQRRTFIRGVLGAGTAALLPRRLFAADGTPAAASPGKVKLACCGIGHRGEEGIKALFATGLANVVALCDTDMGAPHTQAILKMFPNVPRFQDFRQMFDKMGKEIEAVSVSTPDFSHFPIAMLAMSLGKHLYCEKPMTHSFRQTGLMIDAEKKYKVVTQMGNQGHSEANYYQFKAWTEAGIIKNVTKITAFMTMPRRWHGMKVDGYLPEQPIPTSLDWDAWLATALEHKYNVGYTQGDWRSWLDFGNGALGDWGAHIFDTAHQFLELGLPTAVDVKLEGYSPFIFPQASVLSFKFPARGSMPPLELTWNDGPKNLPELPASFGAFVTDPNIPPPSKGSAGPIQKPVGKVIYGEGLTFKGGSHGSTLHIIPEEKAQEMASSLPPVPKTTSNHFKNFLLACQGVEKTRSPFAIAGPLCQVLMLGVIGQRINARLEFNRDSQQITNNKLGNDLLAGVPPRPGWEQFYKL